MFVVRKMRWHPVQDDTDVVLVQIIDQVHEVLRRSEARAGSVVAGDLVSPRAEERMLHHRQQFDVSESHVVHVVGQLGRELAVTQRAIAFFRHAHPRSQMHFVGRDGSVRLVAIMARPQPLVVVPLIIQFPHDRCRARWDLVVITVGVSLVDLVHVIARAQVIFVDRPMAQSGDKRLPHAGAGPRIHGMRIGIPAVEGANHRDALRVGRPHHEIGAALAVELDHMRAKLLE